MTNSNQETKRLLKEQVVEELRTALVECHKEEFDLLKKIWEIEAREERIREELRRRRAL